MSEPKHTPGPWAVGTGVYDTNTYLRDVDGYHLASVPDEANARRIVACVNACEGYENPDDMRGDAGYYYQWREEAAKLQKQRDELRAALQLIVGTTDPIEDAEEGPACFYCGAQWSNLRARFGKEPAITHKDSCEWEAARTALARCQ